VITFPDIEAIIVPYLAAEYNGANYRVSVKKSPPDQSQSDFEIVVTAAYGAENNFVTKAATLTLEIYAATYASANSFANQVESFIRGCTGESIKRATVLFGPVRLDEDSQLEKRGIEVELIVQGSDN
jgi:hypothetical protein